MAITGGPVVTRVTKVTDGVVVAVEIACADTDKVIAVAAVEAGKGAVGVAEREVTAQNIWMSIAENSATIKKSAARDEAEALMAKTRPQYLQPPPLNI